MEFCSQNFSSELPVQLYQPESGLWYPCHSRHRQGWFSSSAQRYHQPVSVHVIHFVTKGICKLLTVLYKSSAPSVFTWKKACGEILKVRPIRFSWKKKFLIFKTGYISGWLSPEWQEVPKVNQERAQEPQPPSWQVRDAGRGWWLLHHFQLPSWRTLTGLL